MHQNVANSKNLNTKDVGFTKDIMLIWNQFQLHFLKLILFKAHTKLQNQADIMANVSGL